jgi:hypothetical protein
MAPPPWRTSDAKKLLVELYKDKHSWIHLCTPEQIYNTEPLFKQYKWENFQSNFNRLMDKLDLEEECVEYDRMALAQYKRKHPRTPQTNRGEPFWDGHPAQEMLKAFVQQQDKDWKEQRLERKQMPAELHATQTAYQEFTIATFANHYYREMRTLRETVYWQKKRNREGQRQQDHIETLREQEEN